MVQQVNQGSRIARELSGSPVEVGGRTLQLVAHVRGRTWSMGQAGAAAWLRVTPMEVVVTEGDGCVYRVPIRVRSNGARRWMVLAGALVLPLTWLVRRAAQRR